MKAAIIAYLKKDTAVKVALLIALLAAIVLFVGWMNFFAEVKAFRQYQKEQVQKVNCFPTWKKRGEET